MNNLYEELASIQHDIWANWQRYLHSKLIFNLNDQRYELDVEDVDHWVGQINALYDDLTEKEKDSDREQVDKFWPLIEELSAKILEQSEEIKALKNPWIPCSDRLPEDITEYLCRHQNMRPHGMLSKMFWHGEDIEVWTHDYDDSDFEVTHWMPIPPLQDNSLPDDIEQLKKQFPKGVR